MSTRLDIKARRIIDCAAISFTIPDKRRVGASINLVIAAPDGVKARLTWVKRWPACVWFAAGKTYRDCGRGAGPGRCIALPTHLDPAPSWSIVKLNSGHVVVHSHRVRRTVSHEWRSGCRTPLLPLPRFQRSLG
jgi:hypothetical protein